jgi:hypothetical protein
VKKLIVAALQPFEPVILSIVKLIVDSRIPLPWAAYQRLYSVATFGRGERGQLPARGESGISS